MPDAPKLILDYVYEHEAAQPDKVFLTQPVGGGQVIDYSWGQVLDQSRRMAAHLKSLDFPRGARIGMLAKNSAHFLMAELAIWMAGGTTVAIFPTETADNVRFVLEHSEASLLFVGKLDSWGQQRSAVPQELPCIALPLAPETGFETWDAITARTAPVPGRPRRAADDLAMLLYTSGSTGQPKGVMQSFGRVTRVIESSLADRNIQLPEGIERRVLSYLPLAHAYERAVVECQALISGRARVFFSESLATFMDDLKRTRPTVFYSVPRLWLKFQQAVHAGMPAAQLDTQLADPATHAAVGRKVLAGLGLEETRLAFSGSAPISPALLDWYRRLGLEMREGYAMTEDFVYSHLSTPDMNAPGHVGVTRPGVQVRISPEGEILINSPGQMMGYYKRPDLNAECFTEDGFFRSGDMGEVRPDGQLKLTGRIKELFKTAKGKYVAPAPIENRLLAHSMLESAMVSGVGQPAPYAVVVLAETLRPQTGNATVRARVEAELSKLLDDVNQNLVLHERLRMLVVAREPWTIENGQLTPTMKIKRSRIEESVAPQVEGWYGQSGAVLWA